MYDSFGDDATVRRLAGRREQGSSNGKQDRNDAYAARRNGLGHSVVQLGGGALLMPTAVIAVAADSDDPGFGSAVTLWRAVGWIGSCSRCFMSMQELSMHRLSGSRFVGLVILVCALPMTATAAGSIARPAPRILSAAWGTDNGVGCPNGPRGLDNIPVTFNVFIRPSSIQTTDFQVVRSDGTVATPTCAIQFPPNESDERQTVNLIGNFGDSVNGPTPVAIRVVGALRGKAPGALRWRPIPPLPQATVTPLSGGPYIVDAWTLTPAIYHRDRNRCMVGKTFVRVVWSNGLTAYPTGAEVGGPVIASYRAIYTLRNGKAGAIAPLAVADLHDHAKVANDDNMQDLCLPQTPRGATLTEVTIGGGLIQDPNGDPNVAQKFNLPRPDRDARQSDHRGRSFRALQ